MLRHIHYSKAHPATKHSRSDSINMAPQLTLRTYCTSLSRLGRLELGLPQHHLHVRLQQFAAIKGLMQAHGELPVEGQHLRRAERAVARRIHQAHDDIQRRRQRQLILASLARHQEDHITHGARDERLASGKQAHVAHPARDPGAAKERPHDTAHSRLPRVLPANRRRAEVVSEEKGALAAD